MEGFNASSNAVLNVCRVENGVKITLNEKPPKRLLLRRTMCSAGDGGKFRQSFAVACFSRGSFCSRSSFPASSSCSKIGPTGRSDLRSIRKLELRENKQKRKRGRRKRRRRRLHAGDVTRLPVVRGKKSHYRFRSRTPTQTDSRVKKWRTSLTSREQL